MKLITVLMVTCLGVAMLCSMAESASVQNLIQNEKNLKATSTNQVKGCSFGGTCCFAPNGNLHKCPHVGGVCCPRSRYCCPANHACVGSGDQPACQKVADSSEDSCGGNSCVVPVQSQGCGSQCQQESSNPDQFNIPIKVFVEKSAPQAPDNLRPLDGVSDLAKSLPAGVTITNTRSSRNGMTITTTLTKQTPDSGKGSLSPSSSPSLSSESSLSSHSSESSSLESSSFESSMASPPPHEASAPMRALESSEMSLAASALESSAPSLPSIGASSIPSAVGLGSESGNCDTGDCAPKRGKLKINSNVEITIGGKKRSL